MAPTKFEQGTAVERDERAAANGTSAYRGFIGEEWNCPIVPHGGIVTATAARAMAAEVGAPDQRLRTITTVFAGPVRAGDVEIDVSVLRRGRSLTQLSATMRNPGADAGSVLTAVFGAPRPGFEFTDLTPPDVKPPHECPSFRDEPPPEWAEERGDRPPMNFWEHVEGRPALGHAPWDDYVPMSSECGSWYRFDEPPRLADGRIDPLSLLTLCDTMPGAVGERMGQRGHSWMPPSADLTVHLLDDTTSERVFGRNRARHAGDGYASAEMEIWDLEAGRLVAYGTQMMVFVFPDGPPPPEERRPPPA